ncbi:GntR family transcriptional regulator [Brachybacterium phenoliresistens]|uniref:GntR family transcriptional regulator n=1 Tax=Brachybacterium phenoliresistens TaxID=396014 RepID=Z9JP88_9MICO|nr:GntR family transcriptional regulator [Brachybacterium phenoliresistens]EWS79838.1 GntR family transcriptional regulator [Brachybacterium phenoliresistens]
MTALVVDLEDPTPPYEQIRRAVIAQIDRGTIGTGDRLPSIRTLARDLGLAPGTVARAYKELEAEGVIETRRGGGTRVAAGPAAPAEIPPQLQEILDGAVRAAREAGFGDDAIRRAARRSLDGTAPPPGGTAPPP